jgi:hypothetical protein
MRTHIEGMGLVGSMLTTLLLRRGVSPDDITWHDTRDPRVAWQASTGAIYPSGSEKFGPDEQCWQVWQDWHHEGLFGEHCERSTYVFGSKAPPHQGRYPLACRTQHSLGIAGLPSFHLNAQTLVPAVRSRLHAQRVEVGEVLPQDVDYYIIAHGWGQRLSYVYWGWTRLVTLTYDQQYATAGRPCVYFRPNKVQMAYAYPVAGTKWWYAGSSIIKQRADARKSLAMEPKYAKWKELFEQLSGGAFRVAQEGPYMDGWRPATAPEDTSWLRRKGNVLTVRPLWNSGIRHMPAQWAPIAKQLGLRP